MGLKEVGVSEPAVGAAGSEAWKAEEAGARVEVMGFEAEVGGEGLEDTP